MTRHRDLENKCKNRYIANEVQQYCLLTRKLCFLDSVKCQIPGEAKNV